MTPERVPIPADRAILESATVPEGETQRLDRAASALLRAFPTRASARKAALRGELAVDGVISEPARWVEPGSVVAWIEPVDHPIPVLRRPVPVVFEDEVMAVVQKPGGWATSGNLPRTLERALPFSLAPSSAGDALRRPRPVHRLDAPTAGLVVVAKTRTAHASLGWAFQQREVAKRYRAVVVGRLDGEPVVDAAIDGREARTRFRVLEHARALRGGWITRVDAWPETGRTHQIRRHLAELGTPVLGDRLYGLEGKVLRHKGLFLFALGLSFAHPITGASLVFNAPEPGKVRSWFVREQRRWERWNGEPSEE